MLYGKYTFTCKLEDDAQLPEYKGSTFRGVFGHALKRVVCALRLQECESCLLQSDCLYALVFEGNLIKEANFNAPVSAPPHPFVIEPPDDIRTSYKAGDEFTCRLSLFGDFNRKLAYFIYAFEQMGRIGIGRRINGVRSHFALKNVIWKDRIVYQPDNQRLELPEKLVNLTLDPIVLNNNGENQIKVTLETPLRIKHKGRLSNGLPFHLMVRGMLRRVSSVMAACGEGEPHLDYHGLVDLSRSVRVADSNTRWYDWKRYSNRQDRSMLMGGIVGSITYEGKIKPFLPLIEVAAKLHIGKQTTFGLGKFSAVIL